jgi:hypothetical protein
MFTFMVLSPKAQKTALGKTVMRAPRALQASGREVRAVGAAVRVLCKGRGG